MALGDETTRISTNITLQFKEATTLISTYFLLKIHTRIQKVSPAIPEPQTPLHYNPPPQQHSLSEQGARLLNSTKPIEFFDAIYSSREMTDPIQQTNLYRQQHPDLCKYAETTYEEMRCFIGLLLWTSLVVLPNRRAYFATSEVYNLPDIKIHMTRDRFEQLFRMLHCADNEQLPADLGKAKRFEAKLGRQLTGVNTNSAQLLQPARGLSVDEMMVKFYGRSVVRQYMPQKPTKYGVKIWGLCCSCCGYSITQEMHLGSTVEVVGGRQVVIQLAEPYFYKGHVIYCDRFFSHLDLAAYLRSVSTGMVGTSNMKPTSLPPDLAYYLVDNMHPLTWCYKWYNYRGKIEYRDKQGEKRIVPVDEAVCVLMR